MQGSGAGASGLGTGVCAPLFVAQYPLTRFPVRPPLIYNCEFTIPKPLIFSLSASRIFCWTPGVRAFSPNGAS